MNYDLMKTRLKGKSKLMERVGNDCKKTMKESENIYLKLINDRDCGAKIRREHQMEYKDMFF